MVKSGGSRVGWLGFESLFYLSTYDLEKLTQLFVPPPTHLLMSVVRIQINNTFIAINSVTGTQQVFNKCYVLFLQTELGQKE